MPPNDESIFDKIPYLRDGLLLLALGVLIGVIAWFVKGAKSTGNGFTIHVDEQDISFTGKFPASMQTTVINFLRNDVAVPGAYQIRCNWEGRTLTVRVEGEQARLMEQRIRNFLKLNIKPSKPSAP